VKSEMAKGERVLLGSVAQIERYIVEPSVITPADICLSLEDLDADSGMVQMHASRDLPKSSKFRFSPNHVLYGKLRPYLRKVVRPDISGVCSTDILPILPGSRLDRDYLFHFLRTPEFTAKATATAVGVNLPRLSPAILSTFDIPLPPLPEQRRIAEVLDRAEALRAKRRATLAQLDSLTQSLFLDLFGDPANNPKGWPCKPFGSLASKFSDGPFGSNLKTEHYTETGVRIVRLQYFGQNLGRHVMHGAVVTQLCLDRAGFFPAALRDEPVSKAVKQMWGARAPLETGPGKGPSRLARRRAGCEGGAAHGAQARMDMTGPRAGGAGLPVVPAGTLGRGADPPCPLEARFVIGPEARRRPGDVGAQEASEAGGGGLDDSDNPPGAFALPRVAPRRGEHHPLLPRRPLRKARERRPRPVAVVWLRAAGAATWRPASKVAAVRGALCRSAAGRRPGLPQGIAPCWPRHRGPHGGVGRRPAAGRHEALGRDSDQGGWLPSPRRGLREARSGHPGGRRPRWPGHRATPARSWLPRAPDGSGHRSSRARGHRYAGRWGGEPWPQAPAPVHGPAGPPASSRPGAGRPRLERAHSDGHRALHGRD
jgi:hypothetical protein